MGVDEEGRDAAGIEAAISNCSEIHVLPLSPHPKSNDDGSPELTKGDVSFVINPNHRALFTRLGGGKKYINKLFGSRRDVVTKDKSKTIKTEMDTILEAKPVEENASDNVQQIKECLDRHSQTNLQPKISETPKSQKEEFIIGHMPDNLIASDISEIIIPHTNVTIVTQKSSEKSTIEGRSTGIFQDDPSITPKIEIPTVLCVLEDVYKGTADLLLDVYDVVFPLLSLNANGELSFCTCIGGLGRGGSEERPQYDCLEKSISLDRTAQHGLLTGIQAVIDDEYNSSGTEIRRDTRNQYNSMWRDSEVGDSIESVATSYSYRPEPAQQFQMNSYQHAQGEPYRQYPGVPSQSISGLIPPSISSLTATAQLGKIYPPPNPVHNEIFATEDIATFTAKCQRGTTSSAASNMISDSSSEDNIDERQDRYAIIEEEEDERDLTPSVSPTRITMVNQLTDRYHVSDNTTMTHQDHQGKHFLGADSSRYTTWNNHIMTTQDQYLPAPRVLTSDNSTCNNLHHMQHQVHQILHQHQNSESKQLASFAC